MFGSKCTAVPLHTVWERHLLHHTVWCLASITGSPGASRLLARCLGV